MMRNRLAAFGIVAMLAGCGGGSTTPGAAAPVLAVPSASGNGAASVVQVPATFTVRIPQQTSTSATGRRPQYVSTAIASVDFHLTAVSPTSGGTYAGALNTDVLVPLTYGSGNCTLVSTVETCTGTATVPAPATDTYTVYTYSTTTPTVGTTTPLSVYAGYSAVMTLAGPNMLAVATDGVPASIAFSPAAVTAVPSVTSVYSTRIVATDAGGATLIGGQPFANATGTAGTVNFTGCSTHLVPAPATFTAATPAVLSGDAISIAYDGGGTVGAAITCSATGPGSLTATYSLTPTTVSITEYGVPPGTANSPHYLTGGPDGYLWITNNATFSIQKMTTAGATNNLDQYQTPNGASQPWDIAEGPDGLLWFTEANGNNIGKVTTTGAFTEYPVPTSASIPRGIAVGPDGNLWFTENGGSKIGKITTTGTITEYATPTSSSGPNSIVAGPDGNLWFTENTGNNIAKVTTAGVFTEYALAANRGPVDITVGSDGNLWFTEATANNIAKSTTSGTITEYSVPQASATLKGLVSGPDGAIWFSEFAIAANAIGRVTTSGSFSNYSLPTASAKPWGLTVGPDGNIWFCESNKNNVGVLVP